MRRYRENRPYCLDQNAATSILSEPQLPSSGRYTKLEPNELKTIMFGSSGASGSDVGLCLFQGS